MSGALEALGSAGSTPACSPGSSRNIRGVRGLGSVGISGDQNKLMASIGGFRLKQGIETHRIGLSVKQGSKRWGQPSRSQRLVPASKSALTILWETDSSSLKCCSHLSLDAVGHL